MWVAVGQLTAGFLLTELVCKECLDYQCTVSQARLQALLLPGEGGVLSVSVHHLGVPLSITGTGLDRRVTPQLVGIIPTIHPPRMTMPCAWKQHLPGSSQNTIPVTTLYVRTAWCVYSTVAGYSMLLYGGIQYSTLGGYSTLLYSSAHRTAPSICMAILMHVPSYAIPVLVFRSSNTPSIQQYCCVQTFTSLTAGRRAWARYPGANCKLCAQ